MQTGQLAGRQVPLIGVGTWNLDKVPRSQAVIALRRAFDAGLIHVDTAEMYGSGRVEELVGEAIANRRSELFLTSKVLPSNASRAGVVEACHRSLARLGTDRLDLYLLHWPGGHPLQETVAGFEDLRAAGKILAWGVSNFEASLLEQAIALAGPGRVACNQVRYNLHDRGVERELLPLAEQLGVAVVGYSPFGDGAFQSHPEILRIAANHHATPHQVALAFLVRGGRAFAIPKAVSPAHVDQNAAAGSLQLTSEEEHLLDAAFRA
jgi:diketogulonate reductase-like aldo/keto reductase